MTDPSVSIARCAQPGVPVPGRPAARARPYIRALTGVVPRQVHGRDKRGTRRATGGNRTPCNNRLFCLTSTNFRGAVKKGPRKPDFCSGRKPGGARERPMTDPSVSITRCAQPGEPVPGCPAGAWTTVARTVAVRATVPPSRYPARRPARRRGRPLLPAGRVPARIDAWLGAGCQARPRARRGRLDAAGGVEAGCLRSRAAGQPAPPAGSQGRLPLPPATARARTGSPPGTTPRPPLPAFPSGRAGRVPHRPAAQHARGAFPLSPFPRPAAPGSRAAAGPAGAGLDAAGGAERPSSRTHGRAAPGNANRSRPAPATPAAATPEPRATRC